MRMAWPQYDGVRQRSRFSSITNTREQLLPLELVILLMAGFLAAAATTLIEFSLRIPGHSIIRAMFPMAFGLAAAPRRGAGCVMGGSTVVSATLFQFGGFGGLGYGAMTSLYATGPFLDIAIRWMKGGRRLYFGLAMAGLASNITAFLVRGGIKYAGADHSHGMLLAFWKPRAVFTYPVCGLVAGLFSAWVWFRFRDSDESG